MDKRLSCLSFMIPVSVNYFDGFGSECVTSCQSTLISSNTLAAALIHKEVFTLYLQIGDCRESESKKYFWHFGSHLHPERRQVLIFITSLINMCIRCQIYVRTDGSGKQQNKHRVSSCLQPLSNKAGGLMSESAASRT